MADKPQQPTKTFWSKAGTNSKAGFDKLWGWADKLGAPVNKLSNKLGSESFWPTTLDKESEKAARILQSFCKDGFYEEELQAPAEGGPKQKQKVIKKIPVEVIQKAKGLAIFTTMRTGLWISGAGGSGVLVARKEDGNWGPPVGIMLHTAGLGFLVGVDIYDCVLVLNTDKAVEAFSKWRATVGGEISAVAGPAGIGGVLDSELNKRASPIFAYLKSRGFYAGVQVDGTVIIERVDENERFYGQKLPAMDILMGKVQPRERELEMLMETLKAAQGDKNVRSSLLPNEPAPADYEVVESDHRFGVPDKEDPDPYGVLALENAGMVIKEAGTKMRASTDQFEFNPKPTSPVFRSSFDGSASQRSVRSSWRESRVERPYRTSEMGVQTDFEPPPTPTKRASGPPPPLPPRHSVQPSLSARSVHSIHSTTIEEEQPRDLGITMKDNDQDGASEVFSEDQPVQKRISNPVEGYTQTTPMINGFHEEIVHHPVVADDVEKKVEQQGVKATIDPQHLEDVTLDDKDEQLDVVELAQDDHTTPTKAELGEAKEPEIGSPADEDDDYSDDDSDDVAEVHEIHEARAPQAIQARMVSVPKRMTPQLPSRNPGRMRSAQSISSHQQSETSSLHSIAASNTDADGFTSHDSHRRSSVTSNPPSPGKSTSLRSVASEVQVAHAKPAEDELEVKPEPVTVPETAELMPGGFPEPASPPALPSRSVQREKSPAVVAGNDTTEQKKETEKDTEEVEATRGEKTEEKVEQKAEETKSPSPLSRGRSLTRAESPAKDHVGVASDVDVDGYSEPEIVTATAQERKPSEPQNRISMAQIRGGLHDDDDDDDDERSRSPSMTRTVSNGKVGGMMYRAS